MTQSPRSERRTHQRVLSLFPWSQSLACVPGTGFQRSHHRKDSVEPKRGREYFKIMSDHDIQVLESQFPAVSGAAFAAARRSVLASGQSVLQSEGGMVVRVFPDGHREMVKEIEPPTLLKTGTIYTIE
jgi:hypothetical protein